MRPFVGGPFALLIRGRSKYVAGLCVALLSLLRLPTAEAQARMDCPARALAGQVTDRGWVAYRNGDAVAAEAAFKRALSLCPDNAGALTGAGYAAMRRSRIPDARGYFRRALLADSTSYDAWAGAGMAAYRAGDLPAAHRSFTQALRIIPRDSVALS